MDVIYNMYVYVYMSVYCVHLKMNTECFCGPQWSSKCIFGKQQWSYFESFIFTLSMINPLLLGILIPWSKVIIGRPSNSIFMFCGFNSKEN